MRIIRPGIAVNTANRKSELIGGSAGEDYGAPPTVEAGGPYAGEVLAVIPLDGTVTPGDQAVTGTQWKIVSGGTGTFGNPALVDTTFTPNDAGTYTLRLTASPALGNPVSDEAILEATAVFFSPVVEAGGPYAGDQGTPIMLSGAVTPGSDPTPAILWSIVSGGTGTFVDATKPNTEFTPDDSGAYTLRLTADPADGAAEFDDATLTSNVVIIAPTVDAGGPYAGEKLTPIPIDGTVVVGSDPNPVILWTEFTALGGTFADPAAVDTTFTPDVKGAYDLQLSADPNDGPAQTDLAGLTSEDAVVAPTVEAGGPYSGDEGTPIAIDGTVVVGSDPAPAILWTEPSALGGTFGNASAVDTTFTPSQDGAYTLRLSADPLDGPAVTDDASLTSVFVPVAPTVEAGGPYSGNEATPIALDGTVVVGSDLSPIILWTEPSALGGTFGNPAAVDTTFTPTQAGAYTLRLSVDPDDGAAVTDDASLTSNAVGGGSQLVYDEFTDAPGTPLTSHTPNVGGPWLVDEGVFEIQNNQLDAVNSPIDNDIGTAYIDTGQSDVEITTDVIMGVSGASTPRPVFRYQDHANLWMFRLSTANDFTLYERTDNAYIDHGSVVVDIGNGTTHTIRITCEGAVVNGWVDGGSNIQKTDATVGQTRTRHGLCRYRSSSYAPNEWFDNYTVNTYP